MQYRAAISDLFRSKQEYREEHELLRKPPSSTSGAPGAAPLAADATAVADLIRLVPTGDSTYAVQASPPADVSYRAIKAKLVPSKAGPAVAGQLAPQAPRPSGETGSASDLETRIDQAPNQGPASGDAASPLENLLQQNQVRAFLQVQATQRDNDELFVRMHSGMAVLGSSDWNEAAVHAALVNLVSAGLTAGGLGVNWRPKPGYQELDGLWQLAVAVRGTYLLISDDAALLNGMLAKLDQPIVSQPAVFVAAFNHASERQNFASLTGVLDRPSVGRTPQFFSDNIASLSSLLAGVSAEKIVVHDGGERVAQTVTYTLGQ